MVGAQSRQGVSLGFVQEPSSSRPNPFSPLLPRTLSLVRFAIAVVSSSCFTSCHSLSGQAICAIAFYSNYHFFFFIPSNYSLPGQPVALNFDHHLLRHSSPLPRNVSNFRVRKKIDFLLQGVCSPGFACGVHVASLLLLPPNPRFTWHFCTFHLLSFHTHNSATPIQPRFASQACCASVATALFCFPKLDAPSFFGPTDTIPSWTLLVQNRARITIDLGFHLGDQELDSVNIFWSCVEPFGPVA